MKKLPNDPVIIEAVRTPMGKYAGVLSAIRPDDLLALTIKELIKKAHGNGSDVGEVIAGCANQAGEDNRNIARMSSLLADLPVTVPAITLNRLCASGLDALIASARRIMCGDAELMIAGGVESMSRAPYVMPKSDKPFKLSPPAIYDTALGWRFFNEKLNHVTPPESNGQTAERLASMYDISRLRQDEFALMSHKKAILANEERLFDKEIIPISINKRHEKILIDYDEGPRKDTSIKKLSLLKPVFKKDGSVTAGNSSSLNDGASALLISSMSYARRNNCRPLARIIGYQTCGIDPKIMGLGPVEATTTLLSKLKLSIKDFGAIEINEAFAVQVLSVLHELNIDEENVNPCGGAIALGHPLGCSGARMVTTLVHHMQRKKINLGLASLCVGVGQGVSVALEAI